MPTPFLRWLGPNDRQEVYLLTGAETLIGRSSGVDLILASHSVSRRHAKILKSSDGFTLVDLGSSHGTYLNGERADRQLLRHGDQIRFGQDGLEVMFCTDDSLGDEETTRISEMWEGEGFEQSILSLEKVLPSQDAGYSDLEKMSCILDFHYYLGKNFSSQSTFQQIVKSAIEISGAERGFILLKKPDGFVYEVGMDSAGTPLVQAEFRASQSVVHRAAEEGKPVFMTEGIGSDFAGQESIVAMNLRSIACLPLEAIVGHSDVPEVLGILYLDSQHSMNILSGLDEKILKKLAEEAGQVLEKLELIKNLEERRKLEQELAMAQDTQKSLLPRSLPQFENFHIYAFNNPTRYVGGDFYDFIHLSSGDWSGVLADVCGKGISAALLSSLLQGALSAAFHSTTKPDEVLNRVNRLLCEKSLPNQFVTLFLFVLDQAGAGHFISAGHNPAFLFRSSTGEITHLASDGLILGAFDFATYQTRPFELNQGDVLVIYSDGVTEAQNPIEEMFGEERLLRLIQSEARLGGPALGRCLLRSIEQFTSGMHQTDDITFLIVEKR